MQLGDNQWHQDSNGTWGSLASALQVVEVGLLVLLQVFNKVNTCCPVPCCLISAYPAFSGPLSERAPRQNPLRIEPRASCKLCRCSTTDLFPQLSFGIFISSYGVDKIEGLISAKGVTLPLSYTLHCFFLFQLMPFCFILKQGLTMYWGWPIIH